MSSPDQQSRGQRRERDVPLFQAGLVLAEGDEEVGAGIGIHGGLEGHLGFLELDRRRRLHGVRAGRPEQVADDGDVWIEHLRGGRGCGRWRLRRRGRGGTAAACCACCRSRDLRLERGQPIAVGLSDVFQFLLQLLDLPQQRLGIGCARPGVTPMRTQGAGADCGFCRGTSMRQSRRRRARHERAGQQRGGACRRQRSKRQRGRWDPRAPAGFSSRAVMSHPVLQACAGSRRELHVRWYARSPGSDNPAEAPRRAILDASMRILACARGHDSRSHRHEPPLGRLRRPGDDHHRHLTNRKKLVGPILLQRLDLSPTPRGTPTSDTASSAWPNQPLLQRDSARIQILDSAPLAA